MYSNFNFQIFEKSGSFLSYHNGIANSSKAPLYPALGAGSPTSQYTAVGAVSPTHYNYIIRNSRKSRESK